MSETQDEMNATVRRAGALRLMPVAGVAMVTALIVWGLGGGMTPRLPSASLADAGSQPDVPKTTPAPMNRPRPAPARPVPARPVPVPAPVAQLPPPSPPADVPPPPPQGAPAARIGGEAILKFREGLSDQEIAAFHDQFGTRELYEIPQLRMRRVRLREGVAQSESVGQLRQDPRVESVTPIGGGVVLR